MGAKQFLTFQQFLPFQKFQQIIGLYEWEQSKCLKIVSFPK